MSDGIPLLERVPTGGRLLVVRLGAVGDVVRTLPALAWLSRTRPDVRVTWAVETPSSPLLEGHPMLDDVVILPRAAWERSLADPAGFFPALASMARAGGSLRRRGFHLAVDFQGSLKSGLVTCLSGAPLRAGFDGPHVREGAHRFSTHRFHLPDPSVNRVHRHLVLARALGAEPGPVEVLLPLGREETERAADALRRAAGEGTGPVVVLVPGSSVRQSYKRYPADRFGDVARGLAGSGARPVVAAGPGEEALGREVIRASGGTAGSLPPLGLRGLAAALGTADLVVSGDTGPMHLAWALGTRVVAVFGPTRTDWNAPLGEGHHVLAPSGGPGPRSPEAFDEIPASRVLRAALDCLGETVSPPPRPDLPREEMRS